MFHSGEVEEQIPLPFLTFLNKGDQVLSEDSNGGRATKIHFSGPTSNIKMKSQSKTKKKQTKKKL